MNEGHFKDLLFELIPPPAQKAATRTGGGTAAADLMIMGFPMRLPDTSPPSLCVCHSQMKSEGFLCPRCLAKVCDVPTDCDICGLMIVSSPHLARSYHHLFPVKPYSAVYVSASDCLPVREGAECGLQDVISGHCGPKQTMPWVRSRLQREAVRDGRRIWRGYEPLREVSLSRLPA